MSSQTSRTDVCACNISGEMIRMRASISKVKRAIARNNTLSSSTTLRTVLSGDESLASPTPCLLVGS